MDLWYIHRYLRHNSLPSTLTDRHTHSLRHICLPQNHTRTPYCSCCRSQEAHNLFNTNAVKTNQFFLHRIKHHTQLLYLLLLFSFLFCQYILHTNILFPLFQHITTSLQIVPIIKPIFYQKYKKETSFVVNVQRSDAHARMLI